VLVHDGDNGDKERLGWMYEEDGGGRMIEIGIQQGD
jgi:hypothetical protein